MKTVPLALLAFVISSSDLTAQRPSAKSKPTLYTVSYSHLDTQWLWEYPHSINDHLPATMRENFALFERYPDYIFNFSGANRYRMMKEYYPADYATMKRYVAAGRWFPGGSSMEEGDLNLPSAEAIVRQVLYGNEFFRREFGVAGVDFMVPDCFGFPWSLPSILAHSGIKGFSTSKLVWGSSVPDQPTTPYGLQGKGVPFNFGRWVGPDGRSVIAAMNPGDYIKRITQDWSRADGLDSTASPAPPRPWLERLRENEKQLGLAADYIYVGTGDIGGSPSEGTVSWLQRAVTNRTPDVRVVSARSDQFFRDLTPAQIARLPQYSGEMELTNHSAGSLTSQAYFKRWVRRNEVLADAAEKASVAAELLGARQYPRQRLTDAWTLVLAGHFHDIGAGTSTPKAYEYSWNDQVIAMNQMAGVVEDATEGVAGGLDTRAEGTPLVVFNPLEVEREDPVDALVEFANGLPRAVVVIGPDGKTVPAQVAPANGGRARVTFLAKVPAAGYAVFDVRPSDARPASSLSVTDRTLENHRYRVSLDSRGDIASIRDKALDRELLSAPIRLAIKDDTPAEYPAWNMDWADASKAPRAHVGERGDVTFAITEDGPVRVAITVDRVLDRSRFAQTVRLAAGDAGNRIEVQNVIDWRTGNATLKAQFPLTASDDSATYNWGVGTIRRGTARERMFEVASHQWIDLTDRGGRHGVTILTGDKRGSDKPNENTIGLTLLRTPGLSEGGKLYPHQATQDWGRHEITFGLAGHAGDRSKAGTDWQALRLDVPLLVFSASKHTGSLGKRFSLVKTSTPRLRIMAVKKAERTREYVIRVVELDGRQQPNARITFARPIVRAREINGQEYPLGTPISVDRGSIVTSFGPYQIRSFGVELAPVPLRPAGQPVSRPVALDYELATATNDRTSAKGGFDGTGRALPAELLPREVRYGAVRFQLPVAGTGVKNAIVARGQTIALPAGSFNRVYLLAASTGGDQRAAFRAGDESRELVVQDWGGYVGQWDSRIWKRVEPSAEELAKRQMIQVQVDSQFSVEIVEARRARVDTTIAQATLERSRRTFGHFMASWDLVYDGITPGFIKPAPIAWYASHRHSAAGENEAYAYSYLFAYAIDLPPGASTLTLPDNDRVRIMAVSVSRKVGKSESRSSVRAAWPLFDTLERAIR